MLRDLVSAITIDQGDSLDRVAATLEELVDCLGPSDPTLLAVWAHPDDESYLGGGLIAEITRRGGRVVNVTATLGELGTEDPRRYPPQILAEIRHCELSTALQTLGVHESVTLGYRDGACDQVNDAIGARRIRTVIDDVDPDAVLTFGRDGVTGHPDHLAVGRWTTWALADRFPQTPVIATAAGAAWDETLVEPMREVGAFWPGHPRPAIPGTWSVELGGAVLEQKLAALACHRSQTGTLHDALGPAAYRHLASVEAYRPVNFAAAALMSHPLQPAAAFTALT